MLRSIDQQQETALTTATPDHGRSSPADRLSPSEVSGYIRHAGRVLQARGR
jgi:hypothetical protein